MQRLYDSDNYTTYVKDAFHRYLINGEKDAIQPKERGTKVAGYYKITLEAGKSHTINCRMTIEGQEPHDKAFTKENFDDVFVKRKAEADDFYAQVLPGILLHYLSIIYSGSRKSSATQL